MTNLSLAATARRLQGLSVAPLARRLSTLLPRWLPAVGLGIITLAILYPFYFVVLTSLKTDLESRASPLSLPKQWLWQNYVQAWTEANFSTYFTNSVIILINVVPVVIIGSVLAGYALGRLRFPGNRLLLVYFTAGLGLPQESVVIPLYMLMKDLGLLNTHWSVILPLIGLLSPFGILVMSAFFAQLPSELFDAAKVDGASEFQTLRHISIPVSSPAITSVLVFTSLWTWNSFFIPTVMLTKDHMRTLPLGVAKFIGEFLTQQNLLAAGALISAVPVIVLYMVFQRQFVRGITVGSLK